MKNLLAASLAATGLTALAGKIIAASGDDADSLMPVLAQHITAEVEKRVNDNPLLATLKAAGVHDATALSEMLAHAKEHSEGIQSKLQEEAIRALGQEEGVKAASGAASLPISARQAMTASFTASANAKAGITATEGASRVSAAKPLPTAQNAETAAATGKKWDELTEAQRDRGKAMGFKTDEQREKFAAEILNREGK